MPVRPAGPDAFDTIAHWVAAANQLPTARDLHTWDARPDALAGQLREMDHSVVAHDAAAGAVLVVDADPSQERGWVWGPVVPDPSGREALAEALLDDVTGRLPPALERVSGFPAVDSWMAAWWEAQGVMASGLVHVYRARGHDGPPEPRVRRAQAADLDEVTALHDAEFPQTYLRAAELFEPTRQLWVADRGGRVAGYVCTEPVGADGATLHFLAIDPGARRQGFARDLLGAALGSLPGRAVSLTVADANPARLLYERAGFVRAATGQPFDLYLEG